MLASGVSARTTVVPAALLTSSKPKTSIPVTSGIDIQPLGAAL